MAFKTVMQPLPPPPESGVGNFLDVDGMFVIVLEVVYWTMLIISFIL